MAKVNAHDYFYCRALYSEDGSNLGKFSFASKLPIYITQWVW